MGLVVPSMGRGTILSSSLIKNYGEVNSIERANTDQIDDYR